MKPLTVTSHNGRYVSRYQSFRSARAAWSYAYHVARLYPYEVTVLTIDTPKRFDVVLVTP